MSNAYAETVHDYRLYLLDGQGRIRAARDLQATSDEGALWVATNLGLAQPAELWQRGRRIAAFEPSR